MVAEVEIRMVEEGLITKMLVCSVKNVEFYLVDNK